MTMHGADVERVCIGCHQNQPYSSLLDHMLLERDTVLLGLRRSGSVNNTRHSYVLLTHHSATLPTVQL